MQESDSDRTDLEQSAAMRFSSSIAGGLLLLVLLIVAISAIQTAWTYFSHSGQIGQEETYRFQIDLRTATASELLLIPGFGETLSSRWIEQRAELLEKHKEPMLALSHMQGIGKQKLEAIRPFVIDQASKQSSVELVRSNSQVVSP